MNKIILSRLNLKTFTEQDVLDYCQINNLNFDDIRFLNLSYNELTDISGIKLFKNLNDLWLNDNNLTDISDLKNLNYLRELDLNNNKIEDISAVKNMSSIFSLDISDNLISEISVLSNLNYLKNLKIINLKLELDQIIYINNCKSLEILYCFGGFKDMKNIEKLNRDKIIPVLFKF